MIWNCVVALCFVGLLALTLQAQTRADMAKVELVALKAHYVTMDCVQVVNFPFEKKQSVNK